MKMTEGDIGLPLGQWATEWLDSMYGRRPRVNAAYCATTPFQPHREPTAMSDLSDAIDELRQWLKRRAHNAPAWEHTRQKFELVALAAESTLPPGAAYCFWLGKDGDTRGDSEHPSRSA